MRSLLKLRADSRKYRLIVLVLVLISFSASVERTVGQASPFDGSRITHVGVIVRDPAKVAKVYSDVFGVNVAEPVDFKGKIDFPNSFTGDRDAHPRYTFVRLPGVGIEIMTPIGGASPWREYLDTYGDGLHHICFSVKDIRQAIAHLQALGGKHEMGGSPGVGYAYVNFRDQLGFTIELSQMPASPPVASTSAAPSVAQAHTALVGTVIEHIGIVVPDVEKAAKLFGAILRVPVPTARTYPGMQFPKGFTGDKNAHPKIITFSMNAGVEFVEAQGGKSPWRDYVEKYGPAIHHLGIPGKVSVPEAVAAFERRGGSVLLAASSGATTVDLKPEPMAIAIELNAPPKK